MTIKTSLIYTALDNNGNIEPTRRRNTIKTIKTERACRNGLGNKSPLELHFKHTMPVCRFNTKTVFFAVTYSCKIFTVFWVRFLANTRNFKTQWVELVTASKSKIRIENKAQWKIIIKSTWSSFSYGKNLLWLWQKHFCYRLFEIRRNI